jgi:hypothetical protein
LAISNSPFGQGRYKAFASVLELNPASRETAESDVPFFLNAAMISAECQSILLARMTYPQCLWLVVILVVTDFYYYTLL